MRSAVSKHQVSRFASPFETTVQHPAARGASGLLRANGIGMAYLGLPHFDLGAHSAKGAGPPNYSRSFPHACRCASPC